MRSPTLLLLVAFLLALPILAAPAAPGMPAARPLGIGKRNASATRSPTRVKRQQANPMAIEAAKKRALQAPSKLQPRAPQASKRMGQRRRRAVDPSTLSKKDYSAFLCPGEGVVACPVVTAGTAVTPEAVTSLTSSLNSVADWFRVGFECIELATEINQCGGCIALGNGQDCTKIDNARATGCEKGTCVVFSCTAGMVPSADRSSCVRREQAPQAAFGAPGNA